MPISITALLVIVAAYPGISGTQAALPPERQIDSSVAPWARVAHADLVKVEAITNLPDGRFHGAETVSRYNAAVVLTRMSHHVSWSKPETEGWMAGLLAATDPRIEQAPNWPKDMDPPCWGELTDMAIFDTVGLVQGYPDGYFRKRRPLTRADLAVIVARCLARMGAAPPQGAAPPWFRDVRGHEWYLGPMLVACRTGMMSGYADRTFRGSRPVSRNELVVTLARLLPYLPSRKAEASPLVNPKEAR